MNANEAAREITKRIFHSSDAIVPLVEEVLAAHDAALISATLACAAERVKEEADAADKQGNLHSFQVGAYMRLGAVKAVEAITPADVAAWQAAHERKG